MSAVEALEAVQLLGVSVFYEGSQDERTTIFNSIELRDCVRGIIEGAGCGPDEMIGTLDPKATSKS
jgi:hypothetical protein